MTTLIDWTVGVSLILIVLALGCTIGIMFYAMLFTHMRYMAVVRDIARVRNYTESVKEQKLRQRRDRLEYEEPVTGGKTAERFREALREIEKQHDEELALESVRPEGATFVSGLVDEKGN